MAYLAFARRHPALYEAMFTLPTRLRFAEADTKSELKDGFAALAAVVAPSSADVGVVTETFWATLHGLAELERSGRIRQSARVERVALVVRGLRGY
jgi:Tetracyclin repressor-like, C-terminal domain